MRRAFGTAGLGLACAVCAAAFGTTSLWVPGVALILLGLGSAAWVGLAAHGASVERVFTASTVQEEEPYPMALAVRSGVVAPPGGEVLEPLVRRPLAMTGRRSRKLRVDVRFARRGRRVVEPTRFVIRDPLGLARREVASAPGEVLVLPRVEPVLAGSASGAGITAVGDRGDTAALAELEMDALRPYRPGSPASRIHWPTVARTGTMVERRLVADADARPLVVLDPRAPEDEEALDRAVRAAGSLSVHLARLGGCSLLLPGDRRGTELAPDLRSWPALHVRLALVEAAAGAPAVPRLERTGAVFWVTASGGAGVPTGLARSAAGARYVVTSAPRGGAAAFTVAGCTGYRVGSARAAVAA